MASDCAGRTQQQIGQEIEKWRKKAGLSQIDLAMILGLKSDRHYRRICIECTYEFSQSQIGRLAKLMQVSTEELIPDEEFDFVLSSQGRAPNAARSARTKIKPRLQQQPGAALQGAGLFTKISCSACGCPQTLPHRPRYAETQWRRPAPRCQTRPPASSPYPRYPDCPPRNRS